MGAAAMSTVTSTGLSGLKLMSGAMRAGATADGWAREERRGLAADDPGMGAAARALHAALAMRHPAAAEHGLRVAALVKAVAPKLALDDTASSRAVLAAALQDVG